MVKNQTTLEEKQARLEEIREQKKRWAKKLIKKVEKFMSMVEYLQFLDYSESMAEIDCRE